MNCFKESNDGFAISTESTTSASTGHRGCDDDNSSKSFAEERRKRANDRLPLVLVLVAGVFMALAFIVFGIRAVELRKKSAFERHADDFSQKFMTSLRDFEVSALWIHQACRERDTRGGQGTNRQNWTGSHCSREDFADLTRYLASTGLRFGKVAWAPNVTNDLRAAVEQETSEFVAINYPNSTYTGFQGLAPNPSDMWEEFIPREEAEYYFP